MSEFWLYNPLVLFDKDHIKELWPSKELSLSEKLNATTRTIILLTVLGFVLTKSIKLLVTSIITLVIIVILYKVQFEKEEKERLKKKAHKEGFEGSRNTKFLEVFKDTFTNPTVKNPLMNVMMTDYKDNPQRKQAAPSYNTKIKEQINQKAKNDERLFKDLGDNLSFQNNMRNFHSMPNTTIPNGQKAFAEFCYGNMPSCKDGDGQQCSKINRRVGGVYY